MTRINNRRPTIRFIPLAVLALAGIMLALTAFPGPASAQTELWAETMTAGSSITSIGYHSGTGQGSLSGPFNFSYRDRNYNVVFIRHFTTGLATGNLGLRIEPALPEPFRKFVTLTLDGGDFPIADADRVSSDGRIFTWNSAGLDWEVDDAVSASLTFNPPWAATLDAKDLGGGFVGCNSSAAESVKCTSALSEDDFSYDGDNFTVRQVSVNSTGRLQLSFSEGDAADADALTLYVGGETFHLGAADDPKNSFDRFWDDAGLDWDAGDTISLQLLEPFKPDPPSKLSAAPHGQNRIDLSWKPPASDGGAPVTGYRIEVQTGGGSWSDRVADTDSTDTEYSHTGLSAGAERRYRVSAINAAGASGTSSTASTTTCAAGTFWCADLTVASFVTAGKDVLGYHGSNGSLEPEGIERGSQSTTVTFLGYIPGGDLIFTLGQ